MKPKTKQDAKIILEGEGDVIDFVTRGVFTQSSRKVNAVLRSMTDDCDITTTSIITGNSVTYSVTGIDHCDAEYLAATLRQVHKNRQHNQIIVMSALAVGCITLSMLIGGGDGGRDCSKRSKSVDSDELLNKN